jgi:perosamine synthetase
MERIEELVARKREILAIYRQRLEKHPAVRMNPEPPGTVNGAWMPTVVFARETGVTREKLLAAFAKENIDARVFFWPLSSLPMFEPVKDNVNAWDIPARAINLPSYHEICNSNLASVCAVVEHVLDIYAMGAE